MVSIQDLCTSTIVTLSPRFHCSWSFLVVSHCYKQQCTCSRCVCVDARMTNRIPVLEKRVETSARAFWLCSYLCGSLWEAITLSMHLILGTIMIRCLAVPVETAIIVVILQSCCSLLLFWFWFIVFLLCRVAAFVAVCFVHPSSQVLEIITVSNLYFISNSFIVIL